MELTIQNNGTVYTLIFEDKAETALAQKHIPLQRVMEMIENNADQWISLHNEEEFILIGEVTITGIVNESQVIIQRVIADVL